MCHGLKIFLGQAPAPPSNINNFEIFAVTEISHKARMVEEGVDWGRSGPSPKLRRGNLERGKSPLN